MRRAARRRSDPLKLPLANQSLLLSPSATETSRKVDDGINLAIHITMASIPRRLLLQSRQCPSRIQCRAAPKHTARSISTTPRRLANEEFKPGSYTPAAATPPGQEVEAAANEASQASSELTEDAIAAAQLKQLVSDLKALDPSVVSDAVRKGQRGIPFATDFDMETAEDFHIEQDDKRKVANGFWAEGEEEMGIDEDYYGDDLTSHGHGELAQHRQLREYNRLIAWEMPLLNRACLPLYSTLTQLDIRY
jgi:small subunit ribosomal protein S35